LYLQELEEEWEKAAAQGNLRFLFLLRNVPCSSLNCCPSAPLYLQELEEEWDKAKPLLKEVLRAAGWSATADSSYEGYLEALAAWQQQQQDAAAADGECGDLWEDQGFAGTAVDCVATAKGT
jgi:hypothetical protein